MIRTPDQRLRVFISSTIKEMAAERKAAREAVASLHLTPVYFEMGARPHPPRELYKAYLEQSHIFVGIYGASYGWIGPGMDISGLEDEYRLSAGKPRLIYVKKTAGDRDEKLKKLLADMETQHASCYQYFSQPEELAGLLANDLAVFLSEQVQAGLEPAREEPAPVPSPLPAPPGRLIGRDQELAELCRLLLADDVRLVSITGTGGTGKTHLAIEAASRLEPHFPDGIHFVTLGTLRDPEELFPSIARQTGIFDSGMQPLQETMVRHFARHKSLLLLDNFEHILPAAPALAGLTLHCPDLKVLVTSRAPLHVRGEQLFPLSSLPVPAPAPVSDTQSLLGVPSVQLFIQRAREVHPALSLDPENIHAIGEICRRLDGLPLAIELAAHRTRILTPSAMLRRMDRVLDTLRHGQQDMPERHQTLRAAIAWSYQLLDEGTRRMFARLAVCNGGWSLEAAEAFAGEPGSDTIARLEALVDQGLVQTLPQTAEPYFTMFLAIREFALEELERIGENDTQRDAHARYYTAFVREMEPYSWKPQRVLWFSRVQREYANIRDAFAFLLQKRDFQTAWQVAASLGLYWITMGKLSEAIHWISDAGINSRPRAGEDLRSGIDPVVRAAAFRTSGMVHFFSADFARALEDLQESVRLFTDAGDELNMARSLSYYAVVSISAGNNKASDCFQQAIRLGQRYDDTYSIVVSSTFLSEVMLACRDPQGALKLVMEALDRCRQEGDLFLLAMVLLQAGNIHLTLTEYRIASEYYQEGLDIHKAFPLGPSVGWFYMGMGFCRLMEGEIDEGRAHFLQGLAIGRESGDLSDIIGGLIGMGCTVFSQGDAAKAARLLGAAESLIQKSGYQLWCSTAVMDEWLRLALNKAHDQEWMDKEMDSGKRWTTERAMEEAFFVPSGEPA